jgi:heptosyltransferase II
LLYDPSATLLGTAIDVTQSAVIQVKPGIGDVIWHLPFIRAIAAASPGGKVTFLAPPTSGACELLAAEPSVAATLYFDHAGSELQRGLNLIRLVALLRRNRFRKLWILDRTTRPALAALLAGIPERIGLGLGRQQWFISNRGISQSHFHDPPIEWLIALMADMGVPLASTEPQLRLDAQTVARIGDRFGARARPWIVLGLGASHPDKDWSQAHWRELLAALRERTEGTLFLIGGERNVARADDLVAASAGAATVNACTLTLTEAVALLHHADLFIGTDSGPMNLAVATSTDAFALFGTTPVLAYSRFIHPITPPGGPARGGMQRILPASVVEQVMPYLSRRRERA